MNAFEVAAIVVGSVITYLLAAMVTAGLAMRFIPDASDYGMEVISGVFWPVCLPAILLGTPAYHLLMRKRGFLHDLLGPFRYVYRAVSGER